MAIQDRERERFVQALRRELEVDGLSLDGVLAHVAKMRKDANRYCWVRSSDLDCFDSRWLSAHDAYGADPDELDDLIDAKMAEDPAVG